MVHVPGKLLIAPDALSRNPNLLPPDPPDDDNEGVTLLPPSMFVHVIDATLSHCITSASSDNPLVLQALQSMNKDIPPAFCSCLSDWQITKGVLTYKGHIYVLDDDNLHHTILLCHHDHKTAGHPGFLKTHQLVATEFWWPSLASYVRKYVEGCATCQQNKANTHPTIPPLTPIKSSCTHPFQQISCDLIMDLPLSLSFDSPGCG